MVDTQVYSDGGFRLVRLGNGWLVGRFGALEAVGAAHLVTTWQGPGGQRVRHEPAAAGREIAEALGLEGAAFLEQVHGGEVLECERAGCAGFGDGLVTVAKGVALFGKSADCPIVLIADRGGRAVGFVHASWRATVAGITPAVVSRMVRLGCRPDDLVACICPSAGPCCYEVGNEVRAVALHKIGPHAAAFFRPGGTCNPGDGAQRGKNRFDLWLANADALARAGLKPESIHAAGVCTICRSDLFPSHRREGESAGRFAAAIGYVRTSIDTAQA